MPPQKGWRKGIKHKEVGLGHIQSYGKPSQLRILSCYHVLGRVPINLIRGADDQKDVFRWKLDLAAGHIPTMLSYKTDDLLM
jgi:hypothetical protein